MSTELKRRLNLTLLSLYGLGTILGAGIYVLVGKVAGTAGIYAPLAFFLSAVIAIFTGISYAELCTRFPKSAGEALYVKAAFSSSFLSSLVGWAVITTGVVSAATLVVGFSGYLNVFLNLPGIIAISLAVIVITLIAYWGILESVSVAAIITIIEMAGLVFVIIALRGQLGDLPARWQELTPPLESGIWFGIILGAFVAFYAFIGFEDMVNVVEEVIDPAKNMPRAIIIALLAATFFYVVIALAAVLSSTPEALNQSESPMVDLIKEDFPTLANTVGIISLIAIVNGALVQIIMGSRLLYGMACQNIAPKLFMQISSLTQTPVYATVAVGFCVWLFALALPLVTLAKMTSFIIVLVFALVNASLFTIRMQEMREAKMKKKIAHAALPLLAFVLCMALAFVPVLSWF